LFFEAGLRQVDSHRALLFKSEISLAIRPKQAFFSRLISPIAQAHHLDPGTEMPSDTEEENNRLSEEQLAGSTLSFITTRSHDVATTIETRHPPR
jgi:hypothetical protein